MSKSNQIHDTHRALVLQGGGALGAYDVGVFQALYDKIRTGGGDGKPLFDIIAGTSSGAMNAARIERISNIDNDISNKLFDYSADTIRQLIKDGYGDAISALK
jgi:NTE family protein